MALIFITSQFFFMRGASAAVLYDPQVEWNTILSPRFAVHYPNGGRNLGIRVSRLAEDVLDDVTELFGFTPSGQIEIVLADISDDANGSAQVMPKNIIRLYVTAPTELAGLSSYDDWLRILLVHEIAHICDIDQTWGVTRILRHIFGKYISLNGYVPQFLSEGVAVYAETMLSKTGRGRSSYVAMLLRSAALENKFLNIDQANIQLADWPAGYGSYFYGGVFHLWLAARYGKDAVRQLHQDIAATPIPYIYWPASLVVFGQTLPSLWAEWQKDETVFARDVAAAVTARGVTQSTAITHHGRNITGSHYSPDGHYVAYSRSSPVDGATVRRIQRDGSGDTDLVLQTYSTQLCFVPDGSGVYYAQGAINERFNTFDDLYHYDFESKDAIRLRDVDQPEKSLRGRDPDVSPDGKRLVFVQNSMHQNKVSIGEFVSEKHDMLRITTLVEGSGDIQHASPRFSPDGKKIAVSSWFPGGLRDILVIDSNDGTLIRRVTHDTALDGNPAWSKDGRFILYESDVDGISNIYAYELETGKYFRITNVIGGAFQPDVAPDNRAMLFRDSTGNGFDIHEMPFAPETWATVDYNGGSGDWQHEGYPAPLPRAKETPLTLKGEEQEEKYSPWRTLLPFQDNWLLIPNIYIFNNDPSFSLSTYGSDVLLRHSYSATVGTSVHTQHFNWAFSYSYDRWYPTLSLAVSDQAVSRITNLGRLTERNLRGGLGFSLPVRQRHILQMSYAIENRAWTEDEIQRRLPFGDFAWISAGYQYRFTRRFPFSVGDEHGRSLSIAARWYGKAVGADFNEALVMVDGRAYINNPLFDNHTLAMRLVSAMALGPDYKEIFYLGGTQGVSAFTTQTERTYPMRGFAPNLDKYPPGTGILAGYLEYRFPLWNVQRGLWTIPVFLERLHAAVFSDFGNTFGTRSNPGIEALAKMQLRAGAGAEARADFSFGWAMPLTVRLGAALPVIEQGRGDFGAWMYYVNFGTVL